MARENHLSHNEYNSPYSMYINTYWYNLYLSYFVVICVNLNRALAPSLKRNPITLGDWLKMNLESIRLSMRYYMFSFLLHHADSIDVMQPIINTYVVSDPMIRLL